MANDYVHFFVIFVHMEMKDTIFMNVVYMYIHYQRTENERSTDKLVLALTEREEGLGTNEAFPWHSAGMQAPNQIASVTWCNHNHPLVT